MKCIHHPRCFPDCIDCEAELRIDPACPEMLTEAELNAPDGPGEDELPTALIVEGGE